MTLKVVSVIPEFVVAFRELYSDHPVSVDGGAYDFDLDIAPASLIRRWIRRNAQFEFSGHSPFQPMEVAHAHALFEWGLNWAIASHFHRYLIIHSAVVEYQNCGVLLSASSGSGKSTLAAELMLSGWRLLSDELALINRELQLLPLARPISLKNASIDVIRLRHPGAVIGPLACETHKGTVAHLRASSESVIENSRTTTPRFVIFPKWKDGSSCKIQSIDPGVAAMRLIDQAFNYSILGTDGFGRLVDLVRAAEAWEIEYSSLDEARELLEALVLDRA